MLGLEMPKRYALEYFQYFKSRPDLMYLFIFALVLRLGYMILMLGQLTPEEILYQCPDARAYINISRGMLGLGPFDEDALLIFGPGYGAFLGVVFFLFGVVPHAVILIQILLSSIGCLLVYRLGMELTGSRAVGLVAGILAAVSFTSISLANVILSDCLFFFLFLLGNLLFLLGLRREKRAYFIFSGICIGVAILIRSIGQFWPLVMIFLVFVLPLEKTPHRLYISRLGLLKKAYIAPLIAVAIMSIWVVRNYYYYSIPMLTFASAGGPANVAGITLARVEEREVSDVRFQWIKDYQRETGDNDISRADEYRIISRAARYVFLHHPMEMIDTHLDLVWENLNSVNEFYRIQLPKYEYQILGKMNWLRDRSLYYLGFLVSMAGFLILLLCRKWRAFIMLGLIYLYFALMIGCTRWQGSRLFYPGQIAWAIVIAFLMVMLVKWVMAAVKYTVERIRRLRFSR